MKISLIIAIILSFFLHLSLSEAISICEPDCEIEKKLTLETEGGDVTFEACPTDIVRLKFLPEDEKNVILTIEERGRKTFYQNGIKVNIENLYSLTSSPTLSYEFPDNDASGLEIWYSCHKHKNETSDPMEYGSHTDKIILEPNSEFHYSLKSDDTYLVDIDLDTTVPTSAFSAVMLGNGNYAIGFKNIRLAMPKTDKLETPEVSIMTSNDIAPADIFSYSFELGARTENVTHPLETTTQAAVAKEKYIMVFVLAVNEQSFVDDHLEDFKKTTWKYMTDACPTLPSDNQIVYSPESGAFSCRHECGMTRSEDRGCVKVGMHLENIPEATFCEGIRDQTFQEYLIEQLKDDSKDLRREFGAKQVAVDGCNEISLKTEWIWVSVGLVGGVVLLSVCIMILKRQGGRTRNAEAVPKNEEDVEDDNGSGNSRYVRVNHNFVMME